MKFANYYYTFYYVKYSNDQANPTFVWSIRICHRCNKTPRLDVAYNSFISKTKRKLLKHVFHFSNILLLPSIYLHRTMFWCKTLSRPENEVQFLTKTRTCTVIRVKIQCNQYFLCFYILVLQNPVVSRPLQIKRP